MFEEELARHTKRYHNLTKGQLIVHGNALIEQAKRIKNNVDCSEEGYIWLMHFIFQLEKDRDNTKT